MKQEESSLSEETQFLSLFLPVLPLQHAVAESQVLVPGNLGSVLSFATDFLRGFWHALHPLRTSVSLYKNANIPTYFRKSVV